MTSVIIQLHSEMVHHEVERAVPGPGAAGSSSGAGLRRQRSCSVCAHAHAHRHLPCMLCVSSAGQEFKSDNQTVVMMFDLV